MDESSLRFLEMGYDSYCFFPRELHPVVAKTGRKQFTRKSSYEHHEELEYILVRGGTGNLLVNGKSHQLERGSICMFMTFDFHCFAPAPGQTLEVDYFRIPIGTFLYIFACPYSDQIGADIAGYSCCPRRFSGSLLTEMEMLFGRLLAMGPAGDGTEAMRIYDLMEIMGKYMKSTDMMRLPTV